MDLDKEELETTKKLNTKEIEKNSGIKEKQEKSSCIEKLADEMLEELGYEKYNEYVYINYHTENEDKDIEFATIIEFDEDEKTFYKDHYGSIGDITMQELKAIYKKYQEKGWL